MKFKGANPIAGYRAVGSKVVTTYTYYFFVDDEGNTVVERQLTAGSAVHQYYTVPALTAVTFAALFADPVTAIVYVDWFLL